MRHPRLTSSGCSELECNIFTERGCIRGECECLHAEAGIVLVAIKLTIVGAALGFGSTGRVCMLCGAR